jgi:tRNA(Ile)-lysidine synthase
MKFEDRIYEFICGNKLISGGDRVLLGVSGGADSVCLFRVILSLQQKFSLCENVTVVHVNHMIRGKAADEDEQFVRELCSRYGVKCHSFKRDIPALSKELGMSEEETGRQVRYEIFNEIAASEGSTKILVAHHKNDLAETVILNMVRGSGLTGLAGISSVRENIVRPLLCVGRQEIEDYLKEIGQDYRTDSTNEELDYTRNKIRHVIIPKLEELNSGAVQHIVSLAMETEKTMCYIEKQAEEVYRISARETSEKNSICLNTLTLKNTDSAVCDKLIHNALIKVAGKRKDITRRHIEAVVSLIFADTGKRVNLPYDMVAVKSYDKLIIKVEKTDVEADDTVVLELDKLSQKTVSIELKTVPEQLRPAGKNAGGNDAEKVAKLEFSLMKPSDADMNFMEKNVYTKIFSYDRILAKKIGSICIRKKQEGDYIVITPDGSSKKLNRVFIDAKTDRADRLVWPLVTLGDEVLWAVGLRYNEAYRVTDETKNILRVSYIYE